MIGLRLEAADREPLFASYSSGTRARSVADLSLEEMEGYPVRVGNESRSARSAIGPSSACASIGCSRAPAECARSPATCETKAHCSHRNKAQGKRYHRHVPEAPTPDSCTAANDRSLDHFVGAGEQRRWHDDAKRLCGLQIDHQLELGRLLDRQLGRVRTLENLVDEPRGTTI